MMGERGNYSDSAKDDIPMHERRLIHVLKFYRKTGHGKDVFVAYKQWAWQKMFYPPEGYLFLDKDPEGEPSLCPQRLLPYNTLRGTISLIFEWDMLSADAMTSWMNMLDEMEADQERVCKVYQPLHIIYIKYMFV